MSKNLENMRTTVLIGCVKSVQEGGRGSKKARKSAYGLNGCSLTRLPGEKVLEFASNDELKDGAFLRLK